MRLHISDDGFAITFHSFGSFEVGVDDILVELVVVERRRVRVAVEEDVVAHEEFDRLDLC